MDYLRAAGLPSDPWEHRVLYDVFEPHAREYDSAHSPAEKQTYYRRFAARVFRRLNVDAPADAHAMHAEAVWRLLGPACLAVFPDVMPVLKELQARGFKLAVVSNWQCGLGHFCTELGLRDFFQEVISSAEVGWAKPQPEIFHEACRRMDVDPRHVLHIGDTPPEDVEGGRNAGLQVIHLRRDASQEAAAAPTISTLGELLRLVEPSDGNRAVR
jgi:putative hydrolase of the HAD superfamily